MSEHSLINSTHSEVVQGGAILCRCHCVSGGSNVAVGLALWLAWRVGDEGLQVGMLPERGRTNLDWLWQHTLFNFLPKGAFRHRDYL